MKSQSLCAGVMAAAVLGGTTLIPAAAGAQSYYHHRQQSKNNWRNLAIGAGALGAYGFLSHNNTLGILGLAGGLYSYNRMQQDQRSENHMDRWRAQAYSQPYYYSRGQRYHRTSVWRNGQRYYRFDRG